MYQRYVTPDSLFFGLVITLNSVTETLCLCMWIYSLFNDTKLPSELQSPLYDYKRHTIERPCFFSGTAWQKSVFLVLNWISETFSHRVWREKQACGKRSSLRRIVCATQIMLKGIAAFIVGHHARMTKLNPDTNSYTKRNTWGHVASPRKEKGKQIRGEREKKKKEWASTNSITQKYPKLKCTQAQLGSFTIERVWN